MNGFLPLSRGDMEERGIKQFDFIYVTGDAYVDHPSFGAAIVTRLLESLGYTVGIDLLKCQILKAIFTTLEVRRQISENLPVKSRLSWGFARERSVLLRSRVRILKRITVNILIF